MKYCIKFGNEKLPISEEEVPKVIQAMNEKKIVMLKVGVINGAFIHGIIKDIHGENGWNYGYQITGGDNVKRTDYLTDIKDIIIDKRALLE